MTEFLVVVVLAFVVIASSTLLGPRLGVASPLVLVAVGVAASFLPVFAGVTIDPEWILAGVLPPLLYSSAVSMPTMNFRREFGAISGLSVLLVVATALILGVFFMLLIPGLGFAWGVAIGAVVSPTDAVATSIIKKTSVSKRVVALLDGESLLNDATALALLRTAIVATAAAFSFWGALGTFAYSVVIAIVIGWAVGLVNLVVRKRVTDPTVNTVLSFAVPFVASVPVTLLGGSGLVAAVVAGLVTGVRAPRDLSPQTRLSDSQNWRTVELVLEGAVFLAMGVQITPIIAGVQRDHGGVGQSVLIAAGALALILIVRALYVGPLLAFLRRWSKHGEQLQTQLHDMKQNMDTPEGKRQAYATMNARQRLNARRTGRQDAAPAPARPASDRQVDRFAHRVTQVLADIEYFRRAPLGWREGTAVVWAGMRGAVTVAAAQSLPENTPQRSVLVLIAFAIAVMSLVVQGGTIAPLLRVLAPEADPVADQHAFAEERQRVFALMRESVRDIPPLTRPEGEPTLEQFEDARRHRLTLLAAQRSALLDARDNGTFDADVLAGALSTLDASQIALEIDSSRTSG